MKQTTRLQKITALLLSVLLMAGCLTVLTPVPASAADTTTSDELKANLNAQSYKRYFEGVLADGAARSQNAAAYLKDHAKGEYTIPVDILDFTQDGVREGDEARSAAALDFMQGVLGADDALYLPETGKITWKVNIPEGDAGLYSIRIEYYAVSGSTSAVERMLYLDGSIPFAESRALSLSKSWYYDYAIDENGKPT